GSTITCSSRSIPASCWSCSRRPLRSMLEIVPQAPAQPSRATLAIHDHALAGELATTAQAGRDDSRLGAYLEMAGWGRVVGGFAAQAGDQPLDRHLQFGGSAAEMPQQVLGERDTDLGCRFHGCSSRERGSSPTPDGNVAIRLGSLAPGSRSITVGMYGAERSRGLRKILRSVRSFTDTGTTTRT